MKKLFIKIIILCGIVFHSLEAINIYIHYLPPQAESLHEMSLCEVYLLDENGIPRIKIPFDAPIKIGKIELSLNPLSNERPKKTVGPNNVEYYVRPSKFRVENLKMKFNNESFACSSDDKNPKYCIQCPSVEPFQDKLLWKFSIKRFNGTAWDAAQETSVYSNQTGPIHFFLQLHENFLHLFTKDQLRSFLQRKDEENFAVPYFKAKDNSVIFCEALPSNRENKLEISGEDCS